MGRFTSHPERPPEVKGHPSCTAGRKVATPIGIIFRKGQDGKDDSYGVHFTCLKDLEGHGEEGHDFWGTLTLSEKSMWVTDSLARAAQYNQPFEADDPDQLWKAITRRPVVCTLVRSMWEGKPQIRPEGKIDAGYSVYTGEIEEEAFDKLIDDGEKRHAELLVALEKKRAAGGSNGGGRKGRFNNDDGGGSSRTPEDPQAGDLPPDDDIPF